MPAHRPADVAALRATPLQEALERLGYHVRTDRDYRPRTCSTTVRVIVEAVDRPRVFELLITGPKWWDLRAGVGGGGAIDLVMHVESMPYRDAVLALRRRRP